MSDIGDGNMVMITIWKIAKTTMMKTFVPPNQAYFSFPNIFKELPVLGIFKSDHIFLSFNFQLQPEHFVDGFTAAKDKVVVDVNLKTEKHF